MTVRKLVLLAAIGLAGCETVPEMQDVQPVGLELACSGSGSRWQTVTSYSNSKDWDGKTKSSTSSVQEQFSGMVRYMETATGPMLSLPEGLMPGLNAGGGGRWRPIKEFVKTDTRISGFAAIGGLGAEAQFAINRRTGDIKIEGGSATFSGTCSAVASGSGPRF